LGDGVRAVAGDVADGHAAPGRLVEWDVAVRAGAGEADHPERWDRGQDAGRPSCQTNSCPCDRTGSMSSTALNCSSPSAQTNLTAGRAYWNCVASEILAGRHDDG